MNIAEFDREFRFRMVKAYPTISRVPNIYEATWDEIDAGFDCIMQSKNLRRTLEMYLERVHREAAPGPHS